MHWENFFHNINTFHKNTKFTKVEENNGELAFLGILFKKNNEKIFVLVQRKPKHTDQYLNYSFHHKQNARKVLLYPCLILHILLLPRKITY